MSTFSPIKEHVPCVPLYAALDPEKDIVEFLATGTLVRIGGTPLLITAAHVIDINTKFILLVAGSEKPVHLNRPALVTPVREGMTRESDPLDFCAIPLTEGEVSTLSMRCRLIDWESEALLDIPPVAWPHKIMGYPAIHNRIDNDTQNLPANLERVDVFEDRNLILHSHSKDYGKHARWYIGLRYDPRRLEATQNRPKIKSLRGYSGGAIWRTDGKAILGFAGLVTESNPPRKTGERLVYGFRATAINDLLLKWRKDGIL